MYFHVHRSEVGQWSVVHVVGEIDLATAPRYRAELIAAGRHAGLTDGRVAVDLTECRLIDSIGIGVTLGAARRVTEASGEFAVITSPAVHRLFERCRLDEVLDLVGSVAELGGGSDQVVVADTALEFGS